MTVKRGFLLHPLAAQDITGIWEYIAENNPLAAAVSIVAVMHGRRNPRVMAAILRGREQRDLATPDQATRGRMSTTTLRSRTR